MNTDTVLNNAASFVSKLLGTSGTRQLVRYAFAGFCVTQFAAAVYSALVVIVAVNPLLANVLSTSCGLCAGYLVHSRWSFAGRKSNGWHVQVMRFLITTLFAFLINTAGVWLLVVRLHLSPLTPVPLMMFVTPWISFLLNRYWVFGAAVSIPARRTEVQSLEF